MNISSSEKSVASRLKTCGLPEYEAQLSSFHQAFDSELRAVVAALHIRPGMRVLDLACGDGYYSRLLSECVGPTGRVTAVDINAAYLEKAREEVSRGRDGSNVDFVRAGIESLPFADETFDLVWCAQSLYSLKEPVAALKHVFRVLRRGGIVGVLENDTLHELSLPWPIALELPVREAELEAFTRGDLHPNKYYIGRRLPSVLAVSGFEPLGFATQAIDRQAPLPEAEAKLLQAYLDTVAERVKPFLDPALFHELEQLVSEDSPRHLLKQPYLTMTWTNVFATGRKP